MTITNTVPSEAAQVTGRRKAVPVSGVTFARALKSEWIKVTTIPSTMILLPTTFAVMVGLAALFAWSVASSQSSGGSAVGAAGLSAEMAYTAPSAGMLFGQLLIASLAVVLISSEWATGMIRSTMVAVPRRTPALLAKNLVIAAVAFVVGAGSGLASYLVAQPILATEGIDYAITADGVLPGIINTGTVLALMAVIAMAIGTLLRNTPGGVVTSIGLLLVLPILIQIFSGLAEWIADAARFLPSSAGQQMVAVTIADGALNQWQGALVLAAWAAVLLVASVVVTKRRDI